MKKRPILYNGQLYSKPIEKGRFGPPKQPQIAFEEARSKILADIVKTKQAISEVPSNLKLPNEFIVCLRIEPEFTAKSYYPDTLFSVEGSLAEFTEVGSRIWGKKTEDENEVEPGKLLFIRATDKGLDNLQKELNKKESGLSKKFIYDLRKIHNLALLKPEEQILGFVDKWEGGRVEAVLHPFSFDKNLVIKHFINFLQNAGVNENTIRKKQYGDGITFVSFYGDRNVLNHMKGYNPLRTAHPLIYRNLPTIRGQLTSGMPQPPVFSIKSNIVVGVFDGGIDETSPYLKNYCENIEASSAAEDDDCISHGTAVSGAILYGPLNNFNHSTILQEPKVSVKSFRVMPSMNSLDPDLYEVIDAIETIVPQQKDIKVYNISIGPSGPILDDQISRFTYSVDLLTVDHNVLFCVAVGNHGEKSDPLNRIQSPADMVNGLSVGSYSEPKGKIKVAPYSSIGPGREGNKLKPDLAAFGGCDQNPMHLVSTKADKKLLAWGTSYASPLVASIAAQIVGFSNNVIDPFVSRIMLIHGVKKNQKGHDLYMGHGPMAHELDEFTNCDPNAYTLIYNGEILPGKYIEFKIPWHNEIFKEKVKLHWTLGVLADVDPKHPDDYTTCAAQVSFYPNSHRFSFKKKGGKKQIIDIKKGAANAKQLIDEGWEMSSFPVSESSPTPFSTEEKLRKDMKWDTVDSRTINKKGQDICDPIFHIHALARGQRDKTKKMKYALVLSVQLPVNYSDFYSKILEMYPALTPVNFVALNQVQIGVNNQKS